MALFATRPKATDPLGLGTLPGSGAGANSPMTATAPIGPGNSVLAMDAMGATTAPRAPKTFLMPSPITPMPDSSGRFVMRHRDSSTFFTQKGISWTVTAPAREVPPDLLKARELRQLERKGWGLHCTLVGARDGALMAEQPTAARVHHYVGAPSAWAPNLPTFERMTWEEPYPGVDMIAEPARGGVQYRFVLSPGARVSDLKMRWEGATALRVVDDGRGVDVETDIGVLRVRGLHAFAMTGVATGHDEERTELPARHVLLASNEVGLQVEGWDGRTPLVIDPTIGWSSYLGASGWDRGYGIATDGSGNVFVTGYTQSTSFPTSGGFDTTFGGGAYGDAFVTKISGIGALLWSSYLGGSNEDVGVGIAVDGSGDAFVTGSTGSTNFPSIGGFDTTRGSFQDAFVTKVSGAGALLWSSYLGGSLNEDAGTAIAVDGSGNAVVTGWTSSTDFPSSGGFDSTCGGPADAFVTKVSGSGTLRWSSYLGGAGEDWANGIATDGSGNAFVTGNARSTDFPSTGGFDTTYGGGTCSGSPCNDAFVTKVSGAGALLWSSYLGGSSNDEGHGIAVDGSGNAVVTGWTSSTDFPSSGGFDASLGGAQDVFVTKISGAGALVWSSFLGGANNDYGYGIATDGSGSVFVTGITQSSDFPTTGGFDTTLDGGDDAFVTKVSATGTQLWSSYLGGTGTDYGLGIATDGSGSAFVTGQASTGFPTTGGFDTTFGGGGDAFVTKLSKGPLGASCADSSECVSLLCVDGVCCDRACTSTCEACTSTKKGSGADGTCGFIADARDPDKECAPQSCTAGVVTKAQLCDGAGACRTDGTIACSFYSCVGTICGSTCATDPDCLPSGFCSGTTCVGDLANGSACTRTSQCKSGFCADGVCCDTACGGPCEACTTTKKGAGADGTCGFIADARDPDMECAPQSCAAGVVTKAQLCNGSGACRSDGTTGCGLYAVCAASACGTACSADGDCVASAFCSGTTCTGDLDTGAACSRPGQCKSGFCADGVCCDKACSGSCEACTAAKKGSGTDGTCGNVAAGTDPQDKCTVDTTAGSCGPDGMCDGAGACRPYRTKGTPCGTTTCTAGSVSGKTCNGAGTCDTLTTPCTPFVCGASACKTSCATGADCVADAFCTPTLVCKPKQKNGEACGAAKECASGLCVDSVCCSSACTGQCEACNVPSDLGTCVPVTGRPKGARKDCDGAGTGCFGTCDGKDRAACTYPLATTTCGAGCADAKIALCDGKGGCSEPISCPEFLTCESETACRKTCAVDTDCIDGYVCAESKCVPKGKKCSPDRSASIDPTGTATPCAPYLCDPSSGLCFSSCASDADCASTYHCDPSGKCGAPSPDAGDAGGCGCAVPGRSDGEDGGAPGAWPIAGLAWLAFRRFRRVRRP